MARATLFRALSALTLFTSLTLARPGNSPSVINKRSLSTESSAPSSAQANCSVCSYWLDEIPHQGLAPYAPDASSYQVYRNVKDFGAVGDGIHDDTKAINDAISAGDRCAPGVCQSSSTTPALVYFPPGTYLISSPIVDYYYTQLIGNPNCLPKIVGSEDFTGIALIDGDPYGSNGDLSYGATNVFWRQVRNFILDTTNIPATAKAIGVHWPTGQATSLQNLAIHLSEAPGNVHTGLLIEGGSGGYMGDLVFYGGSVGASLGNQQFTMRNMTFNNPHTAINMSYDWGWTFTGININNATIGIGMDNGGLSTSVGSILLFDSQITNTETAVLTSFVNPSAKFTNGSIILENVVLNGVQTAVKDLNGTTILAGGSRTIEAFAQGHVYDPTGPKAVQGPITPNVRPPGLVDGGAFYQRSKPQYENVPVSAFLSARTAGAKGDGTTDDTAALNAALQTALQQGKILFLDAGDYAVSGTIYVPAGSTIVGEAYPVILGYGSFFSNVQSPKPIVQLGHAGEVGSIEWSDAIVSTRGPTAGAILFEVNIISPPPASAAVGGVGKRNADEHAPNCTLTAYSTTSTAPAYSSGFATSTKKPCKCKSKSATTTVPQSGPYSTSSGASSYVSSSTTCTGTGSTSATTGSVTSSGISSGVSSTSASSGTSISSGMSTSGSSTSMSITSTSTSSATSSSTSSSSSSSSTSCPPRPTAYTPEGPSGIWDVHARIGGFAGSDLQVAQCNKTPGVTTTTNFDKNCIASFLTMHITRLAANVYLENVWLWVADHDVESPTLEQITVYAGRGLLVESTEPLWLWGTAVEHHTLYQYEFSFASTVYMGQIQTETAYYQPNPPVVFPFAPNPEYDDPVFPTMCFQPQGNWTNSTTFKNYCDGYGLRMVASSDLLVYGAGLYSFFDNYSTDCSNRVPYNPNKGPSPPYGCQTQIFSIEGDSANIGVYTLNTVGAQQMVDVNGASAVNQQDNLNVYPNDIAVFRLAATA